MQATSSQVADGRIIRAVAEGFFRNWRLFAAVAVTLTLTVAIASLCLPKQYRSEMRLLIENSRLNAVITSDRNAAPSLSEITEQQVNSELEILESSDVLGEVVDPGWNLLASAQRTPELLKAHEQRVEAFRRRLKVESARKSNVIEISYTAASPAEATSALEHYAAAYLSYRKQLARPKGTSTFFSDQAGRYQSAWQQATAELVVFQQQHSIVSVQGAEQSITRQLSSYEDDLRTNLASLSEMNARLHAAADAIHRVPIRQETQQHTTANQVSVDQMRTLLVQLQNRRTELLTRYTPKDRLVAEVEHQIADTTNSLNLALSQKGSEDTTDINPAWQGLQTSLIEGQVERRALESKITSIEQTTNQLRHRLSDLQSLDVAFSALEEKADQARSNFELFAEKRDQAQIEDALDERQFSNLAVAESPTSALHAISPKPVLDIALGLLTALFLAAGFVYFIESSRNTFSCARELEAVSRFPVVATVPYAGWHEGQATAGRTATDLFEGSYGALTSPGMVAATQSLRNIEA